MPPICRFFLPNYVSFFEYGLLKTETKFNDVTRNILYLFYIRFFFLSPETINVIHVLESGISIKKIFLLDNGRLKMDAVKQAFCLNSVELYIGEFYGFYLEHCGGGGIVPTRGTRFGRQKFSQNQKLV